MKSNLLNLLKFLIGWPISIISLVFVIKIILPNSSVVLRTFNHLNIFMTLLCIFCFAIYFALRGYIWKEILKNKGYRLNYKNSIFLWSVSELKRYTPGNIWSFIGRTLSFEKLGVKKKDSTKSLFYEAEFFIVGAVIASIFSIGLIFNYLPSFPLEILAQPAIFTGAVLFILVFIFNTELRKKNKFISLIFSILPDFKIAENLKLTSLSFFAVYFFGLGVYFSANSLFYIDPHNFIGLASFFSLALLIGYLSIITPTGLGVREAVITIGLSQIMSLETAAFSSVYARVIFVFTELLFLFFVWIWNNSKSKIFAKIENFIYSRRYEIVLTICIVLYIIYFTYASFLRYDNFFTGRFDLGNMDQTVWNTIHGRIFQLTDPNGTNIVSRLAFHADFILILISPLYLIWSNPKILLLFQTIIVSLGAYFVFLIGKDVLKNKSMSLIFSLAFLLNPAIEQPNLYDFHPVVLATTFLLAAFYFVNKKKYFLTIVFLILAGITKENIWIITAIFGLYIFIRQRKRLLGTLIFTASIAIFYYLVWIAIPKALGGQHFALSYYADFGDSPTTIIKNIIFDPFKTLSVIFHREQLVYLIEIFLPLGFLSFAYPLFLVFIFPNLLINLLSSNAQLHQIYFQYSASIVAFVFISAIYGLKNLKKYTPHLPMAFYGVLILLCTIYSVILIGPLPGSDDPNLEMFTKTLENRRIVGRYIARIPKKYSVAATNNLGSHLSRRELVYTVPQGINTADFIAFLIRSYSKDPQAKTERQILQKVKKNNNYSVVFANGDFIVFERKELINSL